jgi:hypothetical protein
MAGASAFIAAPTLKTQIYEEDTRRRKALMAKIERALSRVGTVPNDADFAQPADAAGVPSVVFAPGSSRTT